MTSVTAHSSMQTQLCNWSVVQQAIAISVTLVLFFGEIFPSAIFTGPRQLEYAAYMCTPAW